MVVLQHPRTRSEPIAHSTPSQRMQRSLKLGRTECIASVLCRLHPAVSARVTFQRLTILLNARTALRSYKGSVLKPFYTESESYSHWRSLTPDFHEKRQAICWMEDYANRTCQPFSRHHAGLIAARQLLSSMTKTQPKSQTGSRRYSIRR